MLKLKRAIPNFFTLSNLSFGIISLIMSFEGNYKLSCYFIILSAIMDRYDGRLARYFNVSCELGKELDSLADIISFGVAPSILVFNLNNFHRFGFLGYIILLIFPLAGAYRLAKYNVTEFEGFFCGIPITVAGTFLAFYSLLTLEKGFYYQVTILLLVFLSYLMVSNIKFKKI